MSETTMHLDGTQLEALAAGGADSSDKKHLAGCADCRKHVAELRVENGFFAAELSSSLRAPAHVERAWGIWSLYAAAAVLMLATGAGFWALARDQRAQHTTDAAEAAPTGGNGGRGAESQNATAPAAGGGKASEPREEERPPAPQSDVEPEYENKTAREWAELLDGPQSEKAIQALSRLGKSAATALVKVLREGNPAQKANAAKALFGISSAKEVIPVLSGLLKDPSFEVRRDAVKLLGSYLDKAPDAVPPLQAALKDRDQAVVEAAEIALKPWEERKKAEEMKRAQLLALAESFEKEGNFMMAREMYTQFLNQPGEEADGARKKDEVASRLAKMELAIAARRKVEEAEKLAADVNALVAAGNYAEAETRIRKALAADPASARLQALLADMTNRGKLVEGMRMLEEARKAVAEKRYDEAMALAAEAVKRRPDDANAKKMLDEIRRQSVEAKRPKGRPVGEADLEAPATPKKEPLVGEKVDF